MSEHNDTILRKKRILLPKFLHQQALKIVHEEHLGIEKYKSLFRQNIYWLSIDKDVINYVNRWHLPKPVHPSKHQDQYTYVEITIVSIELNC